MSEEEQLFEQAVSQIPKFIMNCPIVMHWVKYKGEVKFAILNYERSITAKRAMIDLCYCATRGLNGIVEKTVQYNKLKFQMHDFEPK